MPLLRELNSSIIEITKFITKQQSMMLQKPLNFLSDLISEVISKYPSAEPNILKWDSGEKQETDPSLIGFVPFPLRIMTNLQEISK
jgi:hypothetical protein